MTEKDKELNELRRENRKLKAIVEKLEAEITKWEHCHRKDMEDNIWLKNQVAFLTASDHLLEVPE